MWSVENHLLCPRDERVAACVRTMMMGGVRWYDKNTSHVIDIREVRGNSGELIFIPRDIWGMIFSFLIFEEGYDDGVARTTAKRRRLL